MASVRIFRPAALATRSVLASTRATAAAATARTPLTTPFATAARAPIITRMASQGFHSSAPAYVKVGEEVPSIEVLVENSPGNKVNLAEEFKKSDGIIVGVPGAFSGACSSKHVPSYITHPKLKEAGQVFVVSVNDAFVMKAWGDVLDPTQTSGIRFLGDPAGEFTRALDLEFDATPFFGGPRSKRYALVVEDGKIKSAHVEPDNTGTDVSMADKVFASKDW